MRTDYTMGQSTAREESGARAVQGAAAAEGSPSLTHVQNLARYAARAAFEDLSPASLAQLPIHVLDSLGCCIAALGAGPIQACRQQVTDFGGTGPCALIGGGEANPVYAAFWHRPRALRRLHGQLPRADGDVPHRG
jgi:2-methylcitrate dehydratase PrpD